MARLFTRRGVSAAGREGGARLPIFLILVGLLLLVIRTKIRTDPNIKILSQTYLAGIDRTRNIHSQELLAVDLFVPGMVQSLRRRALWLLGILQGLLVVTLIQLGNKNNKYQMTLGE
jgi:hypothetical protein